MSIEDVAAKVNLLPMDLKRRFLARLSYEITIVARAEPQLQALNEIQHLVTKALSQNVETRADESWIWPTITQLAGEAGIQVQVANAVSRSLHNCLTVH